MQGHGRFACRFWLRGGYDRNVWLRQEVVQKVRYIHKDLLRRGRIARP